MDVRRTLDTASHSFILCSNSIIGLITFYQARWATMSEGSLVVVHTHCLSNVSYCWTSRFSSEGEEWRVELCKVELHCRQQMPLSSLPCVSKAMAKSAMSTKWWPNTNLIVANTNETSFMNPTLANHRNYPVFFLHNLGLFKWQWCILTDQTGHKILSNLIFYLLYIWYWSLWVTVFVIATCVFLVLYKFSKN